MSENEVGVLAGVRRLVTRLACGSGDTVSTNKTSGRIGADADGGNIVKAQSSSPVTTPTATTPSNTAPPTAGNSAVPQHGLRHNPIDVMLNTPEPLAILQGNPSQRTYAATWCNLPVHLHVLTFVKRPNPIAPLPGPTSPHPTVASALDAPPASQANMLTQPDMIAIATEVEAALVQLIAEPPQQVLPVLACAKVVCRAHLGSPGDEHVTQRIVAEVHVVTPRVPGLVPLAQWLRDRWPAVAEAAEAEAPEATAGGGGGGVGGAAGGAGVAKLRPGSGAAPAAGGAAAPPPRPVHGGGGAAAHSAGLRSGPAALGGTRTPAAAATPSSAAAAAPAPAGGAGGAMGSQQAKAAGGADGTGSGPVAEGVRRRDAGQGPTQAAAAGSSTVPAGGIGPVATGRVPKRRRRAGPFAWLGCFAPDPEAAPAPSPQQASAGALAPRTASASAGPAAGGRRLGAPGAGGSNGMGRAAPRHALPPPPPPPRRPLLPLPEALELLIGVAEALRALHRRGLTHGSLTPTTIQLQLQAAPGADMAASASVSASGATHRTRPTGSGPSGQAPSPVLEAATEQPEPSDEGKEGQGQPQPAAGEQGQGSGEVVEAAAEGPSPSAPDGPSHEPVVARSGGSITKSPFRSAAVTAQGAGAAAPEAEVCVPVGPATPPPTPAEAVDAPACDAATSTAAAAALATSGSDLVLATAATPSLLNAAAAADAAASSTQGASTRQSSHQSRSQSQSQSQSQHHRAAGAVRRRGLASRSAGGGGGLRAVLPLPAVGPAVLQLQTWGRARPVSLPRDHLLWCAPELLNTGGLGWGPPLSQIGGAGGSLGSTAVGAGVGLFGGGLGPLDRSLGCRGGNRVGRPHHRPPFGDGSYGAGGGSYGGGGGGGPGGNRRVRCATALLMGQDPTSAASSTYGITPSCDVYSLGLLMWYLVSGRAPFQHLNTQEQVVRAKELGVLDDQLPFSAELPAAYVQLARRCWATVPLQRPPMQVVLAEMRVLRAQLLGLPAPGRDAGGSFGDMTADSRLSFTLSLALSSREYLDDYALTRPPLELALGVPPPPGASSLRAGGAGAAGAISAPGGLVAAVTPQAPPPPLTAALPASLLSALTAPRKPTGGSAGGDGDGGAIMEDDSYSDTDRFTDHASSTDVSGNTQLSSPPTAGNAGRDAAGVSGRLAAVAAAASTARSFRVPRGPGLGGASASVGGANVAGAAGANGGGRGGGSVGPVRNGSNASALASLAAALAAANNSRGGGGGGGGDAGQA